MFDPQAQNNLTEDADDPASQIRFVRKDVDDRFINGTLHAIPADGVAALHDAFRKKISIMIDAALPGADERMTKAAFDYCVEASRARLELTPKKLAQAAADGADMLARRSVSLTRDLDTIENQLRQEMHGVKSLGATMTRTRRSFFKRLKNIFNRHAQSAPDKENPLQWNERGRLYFRLQDNSQSPVRSLVEEYLCARGFTITDYHAGRAVDQRKNEWRIGKILKENQPLLDAFSEDYTRIGAPLMVVLTRSVDDLARGSIGRAWNSCRANVSLAIGYAIKEADAGVMAAYLVTQDDPDIHNPLSRISLKPYDKILGVRGRGRASETLIDQTCTVYAAFNPIGLHCPGFLDAVNTFVDTQFNAGKTGKFQLRKGCESYREFKTITRLPQNAAAALRMLNIPFAERGGKIHVSGDMSLANLGLARLPDLRDVVCHGGIDVSANKLVTLEGLPQAPLKSLKANNNLLVCFAGAGKKVDGAFSYTNNPWLMTTQGAPQAVTYTNGNHKNGQGYDDGNVLTTNTCVGPIEDPARFPSFKTVGEQPKGRLH